MMQLFRFLHRGRAAAAVVGLCAAPLAAGCDDTPTTAMVENALVSPPGSAPAVYKLWWGTTLFPSPVAPGATSPSQRTVPATDYAYALIAPGWSPEAGDRPPALVPVKSESPLSVATHDLLRILVSDQTFVGDCVAGRTLGDEDAQLVVERIFPGEFSGSTYDPTTCRTTALTTDGGPPDASTPADGSAD